MKIFSCNTIIATATMLALAPASAADAQTVVADSTDNMAIAGACIYDKASGQLLGITGIDGKLPQAAASAKTITVQHMSYATTEKPISANACDTVWMTPVRHEISNVTVKAADNDFLRLRAFVRQYNVVNGTPLYFRAGFYDFFIPTKHGATKAVGLKGGEWENRRLADSIASKSNMLWAALQLQAPSLSRSTAYENYAKRYDIDANAHSAEIADAQGRHIGFVKHGTADNTAEISIDSCNAGGKTINLFGFKIAMRNGILCERYDTSTAPPCRGNMLTSYLCMNLYFPKHDTTCDSFTEIYVIGTSTASKQDLKSTRDGNVDTASIDKHSCVPPLSGALAQAVDKMQPRTRNK